MKNQCTHMGNTHIRISIKTMILSISLGSITSTNLQAQGKLTPGYIITNQNDTILGFIKNEGWAKSPAAIEFKIAKKRLNTFSANGLLGFGIVSTNEIFKSKKIGLLDITEKQIYINAPSLDTKDSVQVFLLEIVTGKIGLYEFLNASEQPHYFVEKDNSLKELYNYPFQKFYNDKTYLLVYDDYKKQLTTLCADANGLKANIPAYQKKYLKQYIEKYNGSFANGHKISKSKNDRLTYDLDMNAGFENWNEAHVVMHNKLTYGLGLRVNFPRKFQNRFLKLSYCVTPDVLTDYYQNGFEKVSLKTFEVAVGTYIGAGGVRPYFGVQYSGVRWHYRNDFLGFQAGISYKRRINLEIGHFGNFNSISSEGRFFTPVRISVHYLLNLNFKQNKTRGPSYKTSPRTRI